MPDGSLSFEQITPTRMELLARRAQIELAVQGRDLLKDKRNALVKELRKVADVVLRGSDALEQAAAESRRALHLAMAMDGPESVRSAALAAAGEIFIEAGGATIMGVQVPEITHQAVGRALDHRGYSLAGTSARIDAVADSFEHQLELLLEVATSELRLRRLAEEVGKTTRRVNALEHVLIPRLEQQRDYIQMMLEEREREDLFRLKRVKERLAQRSPPGELMALTAKP
jgi:V/A-type H+-transporting ATPase subunit D